jgi:hypothetical protein
MHRHYTLDEIDKLPLWVGVAGTDGLDNRNIYQARVRKGGSLAVRHLGREAELRDGTLDLETNRFSWYEDYGIKSWNSHFRPYPPEHERVLRKLRSILTQSSEFLSKEELGRTLIDLEI